MGIFKNTMARASLGTLLKLLKIPACLYNVTMDMNHVCLRLCQSEVFIVEFMRTSDQAVGLPGHVPQFHGASQKWTLHVQISDVSFTFLFLIYLLYMYL